MAEIIDLLLFRLDEHRYALPLTAVERVVRAVEVTPLPGAPATVPGVIDVEGHVIPVFSLRRRFGMADREVSPEDQFLIATTNRRSVALVIDEACGLVERERSALTGPNATLAGLDQFQGVVRLDDGLAFIHDLEKFLSLDEALRLDEAIERAERH